MLKYSLGGTFKMVDTRRVGYKLAEKIESNMNVLSSHGKDDLLGNVVAVLKRTDYGLGSPEEGNSAYYVIFNDSALACSSIQRFGAKRFDNDIVFVSVSEFVDKVMHCDFTYLQLMNRSEIIYENDAYDNLVSEVIGTMDGVKHDGDQILFSRFMISKLAGLCYGVKSDLDKDGELTDNVKYMVQSSLYSLDRTCVNRRVSLAIGKDTLIDKQFGCGEIKTKKDLKQLLEAVLKDYEDVIKTSNEYIGNVENIRILHIKVANTLAFYYGDVLRRG